MKNCNKLKNSSVSVGEELSLRVRNIQKKLWDTTKSNGDKGEKVTLVHDKIKINVEVYIWDEHKAAKAVVGKEAVVQKTKGLGENEKHFSLVIVNIIARSVVNKTAELEAFILERPT
ncbi:hypothetical protein HPB50_000044 [Hyalomma asiaticum]|uniref:Uncharacterized protein n=1 Tax=Hyalomma asiaticum TaxID=266040 RepID=A0ACB7SQC2_HYAAI|nr:hypothetical protein HPB50_000044 [Hyalomma asiaticum]